MADSHKSAPRRGPGSFSFSGGERSSEARPHPLQPGFRGLAFTHTPPFGRSVNDASG
jgi:hypothetical protein